MSRPPGAGGTRLPIMPPNAFLLGDTTDNSPNNIC
jgi:hypothetical protein